ncbi:MAG TPA: tripartite tricarboxylate transporter substrate-binding protein [Burkholderiales bacterium]|nr:tripartite tricarboxylate transporter substrate-binding protein [Burkholderiales bacterium]
MIRWLVALLGALVAALPAGAQDYPNRPVKIVVPYGAGVAPDVIARIAGEALSKRLGQQFIIENRVGAGGKIGTEAVAKSPADGYTLLLGSKDTHGVMVHLYPGWSVDPMRDFAPISLLIRIQNVLVANPAFPASAPKELAAASAAAPKGVTYGSPGVGTNLHLFGALLGQQLGLNLVHVPYKSFGEAFPAAVRGDIDLIVCGVPPAVPLVRDGRLKAIAVTGTARSPFLPDVPTFTEAGIPGHESGGWFGLLAPAGTPEPVIKRLSDAVTEIGKSAEYRERVTKMFSEPATNTPAEFAAVIAAETARWGEVVRKAGVKLQ